MLKLRKNKKGFSLVELIVVIAIMAVLAGVVGGTLFSQLNKQKDNSANSELATLANSLKTEIQASTATGATITVANCDEIITTFKSDNDGVFVNEDASNNAPKAGTHNFFISGAADSTTGYVFTIGFYTTKKVRTVKTLTLTFADGKIAVA